MGGPLARNLIRAGKRVRVYNRSPERREQTLAAGTTGVPALSLADMAPCDVVFSCLALPEHALAAMLGPDGAYAHMKRGAIHVELATIDPATARTLAEAAAARGIAYVQCSLGKTPAHAEKAEEPLFVGGDRQAMAALADIWPIIGVFNDVGTYAAACAVKLISNLIGMTNAVVLSEGLRVGEAAGLDGDTLLRLLADTGARSFQMDARGGNMARADYAPTRCSLDVALKDMRLGCAMSRGFGLEVPLLQGALARYEAAASQGLGQKDFAAVHEAALPRP